MTTAVPANVCNLDPIYSSEFTYSLPREILESYLDGKAFDHKESYTAEERERLIEDINDLYAKIWSHPPTRAKEFILTAGAPGAGKTTLMENRLFDHPTHYAYIDPDALCLQHAMRRTYLEELRVALSIIKGNLGSFEANEAAEKAIRKAAYDKWRPGSNAATQIILANLIKQNRGIYFGTTATSPQVSKLFDFLKKRGYEIYILHVTAPDKVRLASIKERDTTFIQTTEEDILKKGAELPLRIQDYLNYADRIYFYYRDDAKKDAVLAATWIREPGFELSTEPSTSTGPQLEGNTAFLSQYMAIKALHNAGCLAAGKPELVWENTVEAGNN